MSAIFGTRARNRGPKTGGKLSQLIKDKLKTKDYDLKTGTLMGKYKKHFALVDSKYMCIYAEFARVSVSMEIECASNILSVSIQIYCCHYFLPQAMTSKNQLEMDDMEEEEEVEEDERSGKENVRVMIRCRPLRGGELNRRETNVVKFQADEKLIEIQDRLFKFDFVFKPESDNEQVYMKSVRQLVDFAFKGYNCTVFLYGQTGTGKTFTHSSLTLNAFKHLFTLIQESDKDVRFLIRASYYELYNEDIRDLLSTKPRSEQRPLELRESKMKGVYVKNLSSFLVNNLAELEKLKRLGDKQRVTASTKMNEHSSRSHSIFSITIETVKSPGGGGKAKEDAASAAAAARSTSSAAAPASNSAFRVGKLNLIDLAGSERQSKSESTGKRLKEASRINLSLTCLSLVIRALTDKRANHVPYRNSKLTRLLSSSLGGNSKTLLIACISPAESNLDETLNTLRFASRTKRIKNKAKINEDTKDALLRKYRKQIEELRLKLSKEQQKLEQNKGSNQSISEEEAINMIEEQQSGDDTNLMQQLMLLRNKIMVGGENLLDKVEMHDKLLEASRRELEEKRQEELRLKEELERKKAMISKMRSTKGDLEAEVLELDEKLKRALKLYKRLKEDERDSNNEHRELKESLIQSIKSTSKEIKFADCIIDDFIPSK